MRELLFFIGFVLACAALLAGWYHHSRGRTPLEWYHRSTWRPRLNTAADRDRRSTERDADRPPEP